MSENKSQDQTVAEGKEGQQSTKTQPQKPKEQQNNNKNSKKIKKEDIQDKEEVDQDSQDDEKKQKKPQNNNNNKQKKPRDNNNNNDRPQKVEFVRKIDVQQEEKKEQEDVPNLQQQSSSSQSNKEADNKKHHGLCKLFKAGKCFYGDKCKFSHGKISVPLNKLCKLFLDQGKCKYEQKCHFVHLSMEEWESQNRHIKPTGQQDNKSKKTNIKTEDTNAVAAKVQGDSEGSGSSSEEEFEYKSKTTLKKEKQTRLAEEHRLHKEHVSKMAVAAEDEKKGKICKIIVENTAAAGSAPSNGSKKENNTENVSEQQAKEKTQQVPQSSQEEERKVENATPAEDIQQQKPEDKEEKGFDLRMIEEMSKVQPSQTKKEVVSTRKYKPWIDISKTDEGKKVAEFNNRTIFKNDYITYAKAANDAYTRDLVQIQRGYMSSFSWLQKNHVFEIKHTPTCKKESLPLNFDIQEGYLLIRVALDPKNAGKDTQYQLMNASIPNVISDVFEEILNNVHQTQQKSVFRTLKYLDNNLEKLFKSAYELIQAQEAEEKRKEEEMLAAKIREEEKAKRQEQNCEGGENEEGEDGEEGEDYEEDADYAEDPYFHQNDDEDEEEKVIEEENEDSDDEDRDFARDLDLNMYCSLKDFQMKGIAHLRVSTLLVDVQCRSCKYNTELTLMNILENTNDTILVNNLICVSCNRISAIYASRPFIIPGAQALAFRLGSHTWNILDIRQVSFEVTCENCVNTIPTSNPYVPGSVYEQACHSCFKQLQFSYMSLSIEKKIDQTYFKKAKNPLAGDALKAKSLRPKKIGNFKQGEPLPKNGACSHYRHSYRFFRFPCCGKAFPCDICHDQSEKHDQIVAKTMICGYCSREQSIKQECSSCKKLLVRLNSNSGHWEGGKGTRNQVALRKTDSHKHAGLGKTVSKSKIKRENMQKK